MLSSFWKNLWCCLAPKTGLDLLTRRIVDCDHLAGFANVCDQCSISSRWLSEHELRQGWSSQTAVVGMSCRSDVTELLEKRVKSRFSYRRRLVLEPGPDQFEDAAEGPPAILGALLRLPQQSQGVPAAFPTRFNTALSAALGHREVAAQLRVLCDRGTSSGIST